MARSLESLVWLRLGLGEFALVVSHCFDLKIRWISNRILTVATRLHLKFHGIGAGPQRPRPDQVNWVICPDSWLVEVALDTVRQCWRGWGVVWWVGKGKRGEEQQFHGAWQWQSGKLLCCPIKLAALCGFRPTHATRFMLHAPRSTHATCRLPYTVASCATRISYRMQISLLLQVKAVCAVAFFPAICSQDKRFNYKMRLDACDFLTGERARHVNKRRGARGDGREVSGTGGLPEVAANPSKWWMTLW